MRRLPAYTVALALPAIAVALPVLSRPVARPHAVRPVVQDVAVSGVDAPAARALREPGSGLSGPARSRVVVLTDRRSTRPFSLVGVTWTEDRALGEVDVSVRTRADGTWGRWETVDSDEDHGPDLGTPDIVGHRAGTSPLWVGRADGVQLRLGVLSGATPRDVRIALVDPGSSDADRSLGVSSPIGGSAASAQASTTRPTIISRAQWGADESIRGDDPEYASTVKMGFVHHTVSSNTYSSAQAAAVVRSVYAYHVRSRGWSDIGYNFLVDRFGRIYEGRAGGVDRPVIGAHTAGFNTSTFGVSLLGTYTTVVPSSAQLAALQRILAWRLQAYHRNPTGTTLLTSAGGTRYAKGVVVRLNTISGHRDGGLTSCPGNQTYARLPGIRAGVRSIIGSNLVDPVVTGASPLYRSGAKVEFRAGLLRPMSWRWRFTSDTGVLVRTILQRDKVTSVSGSWDLRDDAGVLLPPGRYKGVLDAWTWDGNKSVPFHVEVQVRSPLTSGLLVKSPDGLTRLLTSGYYERVPESLAVVLWGSGATLPVQSSQHSAFSLAPAPIADGGWFRTTSGASYVVTGGVRRKVGTAVASALSLPSAPPVLPDAAWLQLPTGPNLSETSRHPDGMLVSDGSKTWRLEQGRRRLLSSPAARTSWAKGRASVAALPGDLALPDGAPLGPAEGTLLRLPDGGGAVVSGDRLRPMAASVASTLGYAVSVAPPATATDLAVVAAGDPITSLTRHPSGALVKSSTGYWQIDQGRRRRVHDSLVAHDARKVLPAKAGDLALAAATLSAPSGFASVGSDGVVRLVSDGRLVPLDAQQATDLGYAGRDLPVLPASSLGQLPPGSLLTTASHVSGSLVSSPDGTWLLEGGSRRPVPASVLATFRGRVVLPATAEDLALPLATIASPPHGTLIRSDNGSRWVVDQGWRRWISPTVSARLGLESMAWLFVPVVDLAGTPAGAPVL